MTDDQPGDDQWSGLPRLADPIAAEDVPTADDPSARALLEAIVHEPSPLEHPRIGWRRRAALLGAVAAVAALVLASVIALQSESDADALFVALDRTTALEQGQLEIDESRTLGDVTVTDRITVRYRGDDEALTSQPDPSRALADLELGPDGFIPDLLEVRTVGGDHYMRVVSDQTDGQWHPATYDGSEPYVTFGARLRAIVENGEQLERCDAEPGITAYCLTTSSSDDVQRFLARVVLSGSADIRVEIDDRTGLLSSFRLTATQVDFDDPAERFERPTYDAVASTWRYQPLPDDWTLDVPQLGDS